MQVATLIKAHGEEVSIEPANGNKFTVDELQGYVGTSSPYVRAGKTHKPVRTIYSDPDAGKQGKPVNVKATALYEFGADSVICGDVVVLAPRSKRIKPLQRVAGFEYSDDVLEHASCPVMDWFHFGLLPPSIS